MRRSHAHAERLLNLSRQIIDSVPSTNPPICASVYKTAIHSSMICLMRYAPRDYRFSCLDAKGSQIRTSFIRATNIRGVCVFALPEVTMEGSKFWDLISSLDSPSGTWYIVDNIMFQKSCSEQSSVRFCVRRTAYMQGGSPG